MRLFCSPILCFAVAFCVGRLCSAGVGRDDIVAGNDNCVVCQTMAAQPWYPGVGQVTWNESGFSNSASATYIGGGWLLTAAHVADGTNFTGAGISNFKFLLAGSTYTANANFVGNFFVAPGWQTSNRDLNAGQDIGLVRLTTSPNVLPANLYAQSDELGREGTIIGYGYGGRGSNGYNSSTPDLKRAGNNMLDVYGGATNVTTYSSNLVFTDFDNPNSSADSSWGSSTPLPYEFLSTLGDSGGGLFVNVDGIDYLAGVDSVGTSVDGNTNSDYGDMAGFTRVSQFIPWIQSITGLSLTQNAPVLPGDYNGDGSVDAGDYVVWRHSLGQVGVGLSADGDHDNSVSDGDYNVWRSHFGTASGQGSTLSSYAIPEPSSAVLMTASAMLLLVARRVA